MNVQLPSQDGVLDIYEFYTSVSLMTPASRMVVALLYAEESELDDGVRRALPVVGLRGAIVEAYEKMYSHDEWQEQYELGPEEETVTRVRENGYRCARHELVTQPLVLWDDEILTADEMRSNIQGKKAMAAYRIVSCTWPETEDETKLAPTFAALAEELVDRRRQRDSAAVADDDEDE
jgi:hypothetical protein